MFKSPENKSGDNSSFTGFRAVVFRASRENIQMVYLANLDDGSVVESIYPDMAFVMDPQLAIAYADLLNAQTNYEKWRIKLV